MRCVSLSVCSATDVPLLHWKHNNKYPLFNWKDYTSTGLWYYRMWKPDVLSCVFAESYWKWRFLGKTDVVFVLLKPHFSMNVWIPSPQVIKSQQRVDYRCGLQLILRWNFPQICFAGFCVTAAAAVDWISSTMQPCLLLTPSPSLWGG